MGTQTAPTLDLIRSTVPAASRCGDVNAYCCIKVVNPYDCNAPQSHIITNVAAIAANDTTATLYVSGTPVGAPIPTVADPFILYPGTILSFGAVELEVLSLGLLTSTNTGVVVNIKKAPASVAANATTSLYRFHVLEGTSNVSEDGSDEQEDVTKNKDGIQKSQDVTSRGLMMPVESFVNKSDKGLWLAAHELANNGGDKGLVSLYGLPGLLTVGMASLMNCKIARQNKTKAKFTMDIEFSSPFKRFNLLEYEKNTDLAVLQEMIGLWGYSLTNFS